MSWYNNTSTDFIDGTQQFTGGSGNISSGGGDVSDTPTGDITDLIQLVNNDTYVKNIYTNGRIYFFIKDADDSSGGNHNTRINKDGNLQYYHTYSILNPQKFSGWYDVGGAIAGLETGAIITGASVATNSTLIIQLETSLNTFLTADYAPFKVATIQNDAIMYELINSLRTNKKGLANWSTSGMYGGKKNIQGAGERTSDLLDAISDNLQQLTPPGSITNMGLSAPQVVAGRVPQLTAQVTELVATRANSLQGWLNNLGTGLTYAGIAGGVYAIYTLIDNSSEEEERDSLMGIANMKEQIQRQIANGTGQDLQTNTYIYVDSLTIDQTTNTGYTTAGIYVVGITNDAILELKIENNSSSVLVASIVNVLKSSDQFSVNDEIFISKTDLDGTGTDLRIVVSALRSLEYIAEKNDLYLSSSIFERQNRQRRRQYIPNKDDFSTDGFNVNQTTTTEPTGESLSQIAISLKVDTSQFSYDATGNLQINNYGTIPVNPSQFQYIGGNLELINYSQINQNATDIGTIQGDVSTIQGDVSTIQGNISTIQGDQALQNTNITNNYNDIYSIFNTEIPGLQNSITTNGTKITNNTNAITTINNTLGTLATQNNLTEIYQLILNDGETPSTTTTKQVNIGFNKNEFNNIIFPLIMGAVKLTSTQEIAFNITDFQGYYWGTYPDMTRLNYNPTITLVKQDNSYYYNDTNWNSGGLVERGGYYFKNEQTGFVYDLNKRFEYLGFHRFKTNISAQNTYVIRTGLEFEEQVGIPSYQPDPDKLQFYLRDNKFYFSHLCRYDLTYYAIRFNQNILNDFINPAVTFTSTISPSGNNRGTLNLNITTSPFNEDYYLRIDDSLEGITRTQMENLFDTNTHSNERFCGMVQNFTGQINPTHEPFGSITLFQAQYTTNYRIARIELEYQFKIRDVTNSFWILSNPQTQSVLNQIVEELDFEFYDVYTSTTASQTIPLNNRVIFSTTTNTIAINFDKSPDIHTYLHTKWRIKPRFISGVSGYSNQGNLGYNYVPNQRSAFIVKVKLFPYIQKTITRELVEEFSDNTTHTLSGFDYNKINLHINLNNHISPFNDIWYKLNDNLDANKYQITIPQSFNTTNFTGITDLPPNVSSLPTDSFNFLTDDFFISSGQQTITELNDILIIGDEDIGITQYETHFGWRFLLPTDNNMSETDLDNYDYLKTYNYYHRTAICDRFFSCKELYADIIDFRNLLVDGNLAYDDMTTSEFSTLSQNSEGFSLKSLSSVNIQNLYGLISNGFVYFDTTTGFTTQTANVTNYWTLVNPVEISYPNTISVDRVNTNTIVLSSGSPSASITFSDGTSLTTATIITDLYNLIQDVSGSTKIKATSDIIFENNSIEKMRLDVNGNLGIGVNPPVEPIDFQHFPTGSFKINNFGHLLMRNTQSTNRWNLSIRNSGLFSISTFSGATYDNGIMPSQYNLVSILPSGNVGIGNNNPNSKLDVVGSINTSDSFTFGGSINTIPASTFAYLANVTSDIQTQINNISSYTDTDTRAVLSTSAGTDINWNVSTNQFDLNPQIQTDITTLNNLIYDDTPTNTTYIDATTNFIVNLNGTQSLKCQNNLIEIRTPPTSTTIPFFRLVQALNNQQGQFYLSGAGNNDLVMDRNTQANNPNSGVALRVGGSDKIRIDGTGTIVIPNQIGTGNPTNSSYGLEIQHGTTAITGSGSFLMENGVFVVGKLQATGNSIFDVNSSSGSFVRINPLGMMLIKNTNNANRFQIGIRNNGELCFGSDTSTTSGTMAGSADKLKVKQTGEVEVRYNLKVGDANGALLTQISLINLPTSAPAQPNIVYRDSQGYLRIS